MILEILLTIGIGIIISIVLIFIIVVIIYIVDKLGPELFYGIIAFIFLSFIIGMIYRFIFNV